MPVLCWRHHTLIQALLSRGPLKEEEFHSLFSDVTGKNAGTNQQLFNDYLRKINMELSYVQFELRAFRNQYDGSVYYGVVNNVADEQSKLGTKYTVPQIAFYKGIIEAIVQDATAQGSLSNIDALYVRLESQVPSGTGSEAQCGLSQVPAAFKNFSASQKEKTIEELIRDKWLCPNPDGKIGLGVRSFLDLRSWFHNNDVPACEVCNEAAVKADLCPNESCSVRIHHYCLKRKFSQRRVERVCPGCGTEWPYIVPKAEILEDIIDDSNDLSQRQTRSQSQSQSQPTRDVSHRKRGRTTCRDVKAEAVGSGGSSQTSVDIPPDMRRKTTRSSARLRSAAS
ncbi:hypothetical protein LguiA_013622 [Lonicera macranthoides]